MQVSVRELKNHLSKYLHEIEKGESIIITSHQVPLARLTPILKSKDKDLQAIFQMEGVRWNGKKPQGNKQAPKVSGNTSSNYVIEDRG
jgi:prevent-host-death family protein